MLASLASDQILAWAAVLTALGGIFATLWNVVATRRERVHAARDAMRQAHQECHDRLLAAQREAEEFSERLHAMILREFEEGSSEAS